MIGKEIIFIFIFPFVVSAVSLDEDAILQLIKQDMKLTSSVSENKPQSKTASDESYEALTHQLASLNDNLMTWLYDEKVDELIHHMEALENLTRDREDFHLDLNSDSGTEEDVGKKPSSEVKIVPNCAAGKICLEVQMKELIEKPKAVKAPVSHKKDATSESEDELNYTADSDSSPEDSTEAPIKKITPTTLATTTTDKAVPKGENHNDLDEWIPYWFLNELIKTNMTVKPGRNLLNNKKFARVGKLLFYDSLPKVKESNEYDVKDIKQLIITNSARGEPTGIIVAENRKFSLDYIDLEDLRTHNDNITSDAKQTQLELQKALNSNATDIFREFRKWSKEKVDKSNKTALRSPSKEDNSHLTDDKTLRGLTLAQKRKAQNAAAKNKLAPERNTKKRHSSWSESDEMSNSNSDDRKKQSESTEQVYKPKRFQVAKPKRSKSKTKEKAKKNQAPPPSQDKTTETVEALSSEEVPKKKAPKKLKSKARIPGKPEHYIQSLGRMYKEGQDFRRLRDQQFLPKRYHWDPSEFASLGYLWFNGHQGKNSPGHYRIAY